MAFPVLVLGLPLVCSESAKEAGAEGPERAHLHSQLLGVKLHL